MERPFKDQLDMVRRLGLQNLQPITIDLAVVKTDAEYNLGGNFFYIKDAPDQDSYIDVKINASNVKAVNWTKQTGFVHPFNRLYITTPTGQTGTMTVLIAAEAPELFNIVDNRSAVSQGITGILGELQGDVTPETWGTEKTVGNAGAVEVLDANANRKGGIIQAKAVNTGIVYIGFDNTVTTTKWIAELQPGQAFTIDNYRGDLWARADAAGQFVGFGEW